MIRSLAVGLALALLAVVLTAAFYRSPLRAFNFAMPKDAGSRVMARGISYGPGNRHRLDIYAPTALSARPRPLIVFFYGGAWMSGAREGYGFVGRALAAKGFVVAIPDYRLVPEVRFPAFLQDNAAAVRWLRRHARDYGFDPDRIVLAGHSAGAYNAAMLALDSRWLGPDRKAIAGFAGLAGPYDFYPFHDSAAVAAFGAWPRPEETQPVRYVGRDAPPALLAYGAEDIRVRPRNSLSLAGRMKRDGVPVTLISYPGIGHVGIVTAIAVPFRARAPVLSDIARFARSAFDAHRD